MHNVFRNSFYSWQTSYFFGWSNPILLLACGRLQGLSNAAYLGNGACTGLTTSMYIIAHATACVKKIQGIQKKQDKYLKKNRVLVLIILGIRIRIGGCLASPTV